MWVPVLVALAAIIATVVLRSRSVDHALRLARSEWSRGEHGRAIARLERILPTLDVAGNPEDSLVICALAEMRAYCGDAGKALGLVSRMPLRAANLSGVQLECLASRAIVYARTGQLPKAKADQGRLCAHDPRHHRLQQVEAEIERARGTLPRHMAQFAQLSPDAFEDAVGRLFRAEGYEVTQTASSGDGGVDLICRSADGIEIVQCKRFTATSVGVQVVRELYGVMGEFGAVRAHVVTSGTFTKGAQEFAVDKPIALVDGEDLAARLAAAT